jgi:hypothetical protein
VNDAFVDELGLPPEIAANLKQRQFRPGLVVNGTPGRNGLTILEVLEATDASSIELLQAPNLAQFSAKTRGSYLNYDSLPPWSVTYDSGVSVGDYAGLMASWVLGTNTGFPSDAFYGGGTAWQSNVLSPISNGLSAWVAYLISGNAEVYRQNDYGKRIWAGRPCGGTNIPCDKGENIRNVMMFDEANTTKDGVFPYTIPSGNINLDGPAAADLAALFIAGTLYDIANEAGLGLHKTDLLIWQTISLSSNYVTFPMRAFGAKVQEAARALWPDPRPGRAGLSLYEEDVADVLTSRGIPLNGVADFRTNLPPAIGPTITASVNNFGSTQPESQPGANSYGLYSAFSNGYTQPGNPQYVAYQFYKHSKYGPCDELQLTDGTFNPTTGAYNDDGTFYLVLTDRELGNLFVLAPGGTIRFRRYRARCPNEATGFYAEDVRPFGFRVIKATPNGFSFTASALSETATNKTYQLTIVDPSVTTLGTATYTWSFTKPPRHRHQRHRQHRPIPSVQRRAVHHQHHPHPRQRNRHAHPPRARQ